MKEIEAEVRGIVMQLFKDTVWPLAARQCIHWASAQRPDILQEFMIDLMEYAENGGDAAVLHRVQCLSEKVRGLAYAYNEQKAGMHE